MPGHVITLAQQKGGSGKTTLAANIAVELASRGSSVAVVDTDPQGSLGRWFMTRLEQVDAPGLDFATASAWGVSYEVKKLLDSHDLVLIDTPPKADSDARHALRAADLVVVPVAASAVDLWATDSVLELSERADAPVMTVLNRARAGTKIADAMVGELANLGATAAKTVIGNRVVFAETLGLGLAAREKQSTGPAAQEISALASEILGRLAKG
ncbi:Chromosome (plasmid) partitioning protein ParA [Candidatus Rhodobacter oscarellae]|uniref:Chromosome (Plasmid) partitioning protein ParA n=1 Tax=Candidatus Rhodobacter oscarellae TaxID=1675527 RepID=A0A0J9GSF4_9RHOB|nr:ParA family partition ATPase [Candidatus Rhodobacter lobularis]KMW56428.1 Chromosome (plasmid) partitioning protein ParA [Candidatus Rhodobacter lobularis]